LYKYDTIMASHKGQSAFAKSGARRCEATSSNRLRREQRQAARRLCSADAAMMPKKQRGWQKD
jgi:hypothetical protein